MRPYTRQISARRAACALLLFALPALAADYTLYVGTYTGKGSEGIYAYRFNSVTGAATPSGLAAKTENPSFLALSKDQRLLYAVNETHDYESSSAGSVTVFRREPRGKLTALQQFSSQGADPCHLALDRTGKVLAIANYTGGNFAWFSLDARGLANPAGAATFKGGAHGPNAERQDSNHAHSVSFSLDNRYLLATDLGSDEVLVRELRNGAITPRNLTAEKTRPGAGPRHLAFGPGGQYVYVLDELDSTVSVFRFVKGALTPIQTISALPKGFGGQNTAAEIAVSTSGRFVYASNRGADTIALFTRSPASGRLTLKAETPSGGKTPRNFTLDPSGSFLLAANQDSGNIVVFRVTPETGELTPLGSPLNVAAPVCLTFAKN